MRLQSYKKQVKRKRKPTKNLLIHYYFGCKDSEYFGYPLMIDLKRIQNISAINLEVSWKVTIIAA
jgi:hypothetical protein